MNNQTKSAKRGVQRHANSIAVMAEATAPASPVIDLTFIDYAVTVNICPDKFVYRKKWNLYSATDQQRILMRIHHDAIDRAFVQTISENHLTNLEPMEVMELNFEDCPSSLNVHFHAYITCSKILMETYIHLINEYKCGQWRTIDSEEVRSREAWLQYIRKDQKSDIDDIMDY